MDNICAYDSCFTLHEAEQTYFWVKGNVGIKAFLAGEGILI